MTEMSNFWFLGHPKYDELCRNFSPVIRKAGNHQLDSTEWTSIHGKMATLLLCDQLSRNCFRGTKEAFQYDPVALKLSKELIQLAIQNDEKSKDIHPVYVNFIVLPMMHSESLECHGKIYEFIDWAEGNQKFKGFSFDNLKFYSRNHTKVIEKFGRYPHRNDKLGRINTEEEENWLKSKDIPGWAKSQG